MSIFIFIKSLIKKKKIFLNNYGRNFRDFTYIDDVIFYTFQAYNKIKSKNSFFNVFNIGGEKTISLNALIKILEKLTKMKAKIKRMPKIDLDPDYSLADSEKIKKFVGKKFSTKLNDGLKKTVKWMKSHVV